MSYIDCSPDWIRGVITGKIQFRKCPVCDNNAIEHQAYDENGEPCGSDVENSERYPCENCEQIGYIEIPS